jgi:hypothetical protein
VYFVLEPLKTTEPTLQQCTLKWEMLILRAHSHPGVHILGNVFTVKLWKGAVLPHPLSILTPYLGSENHHTAPTVTQWRTSLMGLWEHIIAASAPADKLKTKKSKHNKL